MRENHTFFTMRRAMVSGALGVILIALTTLLSSLYVFVFDPLLEKLATARLNETGALVEFRLNTLVARVESVAEVSRSWGKVHLLGIPRSSAELTAFRDLFGAVLSQGAGLSSVVTADEQGRETLLLLDAEGHWRARVMSPPEWGKKARFYVWSEKGRLSETIHSMDYDARKRPWHREALLAGANEVRWTEPYYFRSTGELGISAVVGWLTSDGHRQLFASDLRLIDFSRFTRSLVVGKSGFTAVLTPDGKVIGLPRNVQERDAAPTTLQTPEELGAENLTRGIEAWRRTRMHDSLFSYYAGGARWLGLIRNARLGNREILVCTFAPAADFIPRLSDYALPFVVVLVFTLLLSALIAAQFANRLARPLEQLAKISEKIGRLEFDAPIEVDSSIPEIRNLAQAQETMRRRLEVAARQKRDGRI